MKGRTTQNAGCVVVLFAVLCLGAWPSFAYTPLFRTSPDVAYMKLWNLPENAGARKEVLQTYFRTVNKDISEKRAANYAEYVEAAAQQFQVDPFLIASLMITQSNLVWTARTRSEYGLMMINWDDNRKWIYREYPNVKSLRILFKPVINIRVGTHILKDNLAKSTHDYDETVERYYSKHSLTFREEVFKNYTNLVALYKEKLGAKK
jgi:soluble lytic murein transglycosylase-like protein